MSSGISWLYNTKRHLPGRVIFCKNFFSYKAAEVPPLRINNPTMSQGTLFVTPQIRCLPLKALVKHFNLDIVLSNKEDPVYQKYFPLNKVPAYVGPKGFKLHEVIAIALYCMLLTFELHDERFFSLLNSYPCLNKLCREFQSETFISSFEHN